MLYILITLLLLLMAAYRLFTNRNLPPGPWGFPVIGYLPFLDPKVPHQTLTDLSKKYGDIFGLQLGNIYTVVLANAQFVSSAFARDSVTGRAPLYVTHGIMGGYGLICAEGEMWRTHRKFTAKCLRIFGATRSTSSKSKRLEEFITKEVADCLNALSKNKEAIDPLETLQHSVGSVMCHVVFGKTWPKDDELWKWLQHLQETGTKMIGVAGPLNFLPFLRHIPKYKKAMSFLLDGKYKTHQVYRNLIEEQRKRFDINNALVIPQNIIQAFLREAESNTTDAELFSDQQFYHLLADIFGAGLDTTLTTLRWFILFMAAYPEVQTEIQTELETVLGHRLPGLEDVQLLNLTKAAIAEAQRIRPVVPVGIPHATLEDTVLFGFSIPKGTMVIPLQWAIHMDSNVWQDPNEFNPKRFLDDQGQYSKPKEFIPFQSGKRMCIGDELANMLLFLFGASIVHKFKIVPHEKGRIELDGEIGITLTPKHQRLLFISRFQD